MVEQAEAAFYDSIVPYPKVGDMRAALEAALSALPQEQVSAPKGHVEIAHDGFSGDIIGHYMTREGKRGVVVQQDGTKVVHVYGEKWLAAPAPKGDQ